MPVSERLLGRVLDGMGKPIDGKGDIGSAQWRSIFNSPPDVLRRRRIRDRVATGVRSIDALLTAGKGQRMGIFSGCGVGKSTLLGMIARNTSADVNVIALIGERGREVREFIENDLGRGGPRPLGGGGRHLGQAAPWRASAGPTWPRPSPSTSATRART